MNDKEEITTMTLTSTDISHTNGFLALKDHINGTTKIDNCDPLGAKELKMKCENGLGEKKNDLSSESSVGKEGDPVTAKGVTKITDANDGQTISESVANETQNAATANSNGAVSPLPNTLSVTNIEDITISEKNHKQSVTEKSLESSSSLLAKDHVSDSKSKSDSFEDSTKPSFSNGNDSTTGMDQADENIVELNDSFGEKNTSVPSKDSVTKEETSKVDDGIDIIVNDPPTSSSCSTSKETSQQETDACDAKESDMLEKDDVEENAVSNDSPSRCVKNKDGNRISVLQFNPDSATPNKESRQSESDCCKKINEDDIKDSEGVNTEKDDAILPDNVSSGTDVNNVQKLALGIVVNTEDEFEVELCKDDIQMDEDDVKMTETSANLNEINTKNKTDFMQAENESVENNEKTDESLSNSMDLTVRDLDSNSELEDDGRLVLDNRIDEEMNVDLECDAPDKMDVTSEIESVNVTTKKNMGKSTDMADLTDSQFNANTKSESLEKDEDKTAGEKIVTDTLKEIEKESKLKVADEVKDDQSEVICLETETSCEKTESEVTVEKMIEEKNESHEKLNEVKVERNKCEEKCSNGKEKMHDNSEVKTDNEKTELKIEDEEMKEEHASSPSDDSKAEPSEFKDDFKNGSKQMSVEEISESKDFKADSKQISVEEKKTENDSKAQITEKQGQADGKKVVEDPVDLGGKIKFKDILKSNKGDAPIKQKDEPTENDDASDSDAIVIEENEVSLNSSNEIGSEQKPAEESNEHNNNNNASKRKTSLSTEESSVETEETKRKRNVSSDELLDPSPKRSRLDSVITKLGGHIGAKSPSEVVTVVLMDSDDEESKTETTPVEPPAPKDTKAEEKLGLTLTSTALRSLIFASLKSVIMSHKVEKIKQIEDRMSKMESANTLWKESAKHLEKSVEELTKYSKEIDKRKSQSHKLKHLSSRNVGVQVSVAVQNPPPQAPQLLIQPPKPTSHPPKQSPKPQHRSATLTLPPSFRINHHGQNPVLAASNPQGHTLQRPPLRPGLPPQQQSLRGGGMAANSYPHQNIDQNRQRPLRNPQPSSWAPPTPPPPYSHRAPGMNPSTAIVRPPIQQRQPAVVNLIDLTEEDDNTKKPPAPAQSKVNNSPNNRNILARAVPAQGYSQGGRTAPSQSMNVQHPPPNTVSRYENPRNLVTTPSQNQVRTPMGHTPRTAGPPRQMNTDQSSRPSLPPSVHRHPAPFPSEANNVVVPTTAKFAPPKPSLKISRVAKGIVLSWNMPPANNVESIASYQLFAYQESSSFPSPSSWKKVGDVKALPLPMACTLTQFQEGNKYHFAVRAVDQYGRWGEYSDPSSIFLYPDGTNQGGVRES